MSGIMVDTLGIVWCMLGLCLVHKVFREHLPDGQT